MSMDEWRDMAGMMGGVAAMGRPATGLLVDQMADTGMAGMQHGAKAPSKPAADTAEHQHESAPSGDDEMMATMMALHRRMMADPIIQRRVLADNTMRRLMTDMMEHAPPEHRDHMATMLKAAPVSKTSPPAIPPGKSTVRPKKRTTPAPPVHHTPPPIPGTMPL